MKMQKWLIMLLVLVFCTVTAFGMEPPTRATIAVVDFTNNSNLRMANVGEASNEILSTLLFQTGQFDVVERSKLNAIITEQGLSLSGLVDSTSSTLQIGKLLGADYIATGSIISYNEKNVRFEGYGVSSETLNLELVVNVKILNVNTGKLQFASMFTAQDRVLSTSSASTQNVGIERQLLQKALTEAVNKLVTFMDSQKPVVSEKVNISLTSLPEGADVEIDNVFYGNTPLNIQVNPGLHQVKISYAGYETWGKTINAYEGLQLKATLEKKDEKNTKKLIIEQK